MRLTRKPWVKRLPYTIYVKFSGKPAGYGLQGNVNIAMTNPKPQQQPTYVAQPPPSFHGNASASAYSPSPQATYGNVPLQSAAPMSQRQQSPPPSSEYLPAPSSGIGMTSFTRVFCLDPLNFLIYLLHHRQSDVQCRSTLHSQSVW